jgi:hypothetical protein
MTKGQQGAVAWSFVRHLSSFISGSTQMARLRKLWDAHPNLLSWLVLAIGMVIIVVLAARDVGFKPTQWAALIGATIGLAGLCVWIISWEDDKAT